MICSNCSEELDVEELETSEGVCPHCGEQLYED